MVDYGVAKFAENSEIRILKLERNLNIVIHENNWKIFVYYQCKRLVTEVYLFEEGLLLVSIQFHGQ